MNRSKITTVILLMMTIILILAIFYIANLLTKTDEKTSPTTPIKTKAQTTTYTRFIALNITTTISPTAAQIPTPTEIILAKTSSPSATLTVTATPSATKTQALPKTGFINNAIIIFMGSSIIILLSLIF